MIRGIRGPAICLYVSGAFRAMVTTLRRRRQRPELAAVIAEKIPEKTGEVPVFLTEDSRKALSAVSANFFGHPSDDMLVFGVTGTNGKTTISYLLKSIVNVWGKECGVLGTIALRLRRTEL